MRWNEIHEYCQQRGMQIMPMLKTANELKEVSEQLNQRGFGKKEFETCYLRIIVTMSISMMISSRRLWLVDIQHMQAQANRLAFIYSMQTPDFTTEGAQVL
jgi:hypothetical protein